MIADTIVRALTGREKPSVPLPAYTRFLLCSITRLLYCSIARLLLPAYSTPRSLDCLSTHVPTSVM
jgi:hypothetical protein